MKLAHFFGKLAALALLLLPSFSHAQGSLEINFDGTPALAAGSAVLIQSYSESGMLFTTIDSSSPGFVRQTGGSTVYPGDGTTYLQGALESTLMFDLENGASFGLSSVDLAGYSSPLPDFAVDFVGYRSDGSTITESFSGNGTNFKTYYFNSSWTQGLTRVEIPTAPWSLDNLVVVVPEPGTGALFGLGALALSFWWRKRK